jgi:superfamily I DNA/RNA helicase
MSEDIPEPSTEEDTPNEQQRKLVENHEGIYLADAGPGTGKTFTITCRYAEMLSHGIDPDDILLVTFTESAADEMKRRVIDRSEYDIASLRDAPINTFHGHCNRILNEDGFDAPRYLGIQDNVASSTNLIEDEVVENSEFRSFYHRFVDRHPEYEDLYRAVRDPESLLGLVKSLAAKGAIPTDDGWFSGTGEYLHGDFGEFISSFEEVNRQRGGSQSKLRDDLNDIFRNKTFPRRAPSEGEIRGGGKTVERGVVEDAFGEDREHLKQFVHDLYYEYLEHTLSRNYLNFSFLLALTYVLLHENHRVRDEWSHEYVILDEFQDTSEIQLKLAMLLSERDNICAVGDWKQSIFSFQYASVDNILRFEERLSLYKEELNDGYERVEYPVEDVNEVPLRKNYRSTGEILSFSPKMLTLKGKKEEDVDAESILDSVTELDPGRDVDPKNTDIDAFTTEDEIDGVLSEVERIVDNPEYMVEKEDGERRIEHDDIAILTRTRDFGVDLYERARELGVPAGYEGGVDLFNTDAAKLLLAWLRILDDEDSREGWSVVLEHAGYKLDETRHILDKADYPEDMVSFRNELRQQPNIASVAGVVFGRYGMKDGFTDEIISRVQDAFDSSYMNLGELVDYIEKNIDQGTTYEVDSNLDENTVNIHTIHSVKGLEYPVVFVSNMNEHRFPSSNSGGSVISYDGTAGVRQSKLFVDEDGTDAYVYDNWREAVVSACLPNDYDEERRLLYVAVTRAEDYVFFTSETGSEGRFFQELPIEPREVEPDIEASQHSTESREELVVTTEVEPATVKITPHDIMDEFRSEGGRGRKFGQDVHDFAEAYAKDIDVYPDNDDEENVAEFLDSLCGELRTEERCLLPVETGKRRYVFDGVADLVCVSDDEVRVVDYKTDTHSNGHQEYAKQVSIYYHTLDEVFPNKKIRATVFYTAEGDPVDIDPMSMEQIRGTLSKI